MRTLVLFMYILTLSGCATMSNRTKTILTSVGAGLVAGTIAANLAPKDENPAVHAAVWGGSTAAATAIAGLFVFDEQKRSDELNRKLQIAESELSALRGESSEKEARLIYDSDSAMGRELPNEYRNLVRPGKWSLYRVNQWVAQGENTLVHQDRILQIQPPQFQNPMVTENKKEGETKQ